MCTRCSGMLRLSSNAPVECNLGKRLLACKLSHELAAFMLPDASKSGTLRGQRSNLGVSLEGLSFLNTTTSNHIGSTLHVIQHASPMQCQSKEGYTVAKLSREHFAARPYCPAIRYSSRLPLTCESILCRVRPSLAVPLFVSSFSTPVHSRTRSSLTQGSIL